MIRDRLSFVHATVGSLPRPAPPSLAARTVLDSALTFALFAALGLAAALLLAG